VFSTIKKEKETLPLSIYLGVPFSYPSFYDIEQRLTKKRSHRDMLSSQLDDAVNEDTTSSKRLKITNDLANMQRSIVAAEKQVLKHQKLMML